MPTPHVCGSVTLLLRSHCKPLVRSPQGRIVQLQQFAHLVCRTCRFKLLKRSRLCHFAANAAIYLTILLMVAILLQEVCPSRIGISGTPVAFREGAEATTSVTGTSPSHQEN